MIAANLSDYFARQVDAGVTGNDEHKFVYFKLQTMLFIVPIQSLNEESFVNTKISFTGGNYQLDEAGILEPLSPAIALSQY